MFLLFLRTCTGLSLSWRSMPAGWAWLGLQDDRWGGFGMLLSHYLKHHRPLFPAEVCGVGVMMPGVSLIKPGVERFAGLAVAGAPDPRFLAAGAITLTLMVGLSVWPKGWLRLYSAVLGLLAGYAVALLRGVSEPQDMTALLADGVGLAGQSGRNDIIKSPESSRPQILTIVQGLSTTLVTGLRSFLHSPGNHFDLQHHAGMQVR